MSAPVRQDWSALTPPAYERVNQVVPAIAVMVTRGVSGWRANALTADGDVVASAWALKATDARRAVDGYVANFLGRVSR
ncbi:hypothetical protein [Myxococcus sp. CA040A]|uniref:hypothetical protein n=1 Tax=Myxococcus sp. CA040A TaxID=2741738 RepID=UPI00157B867D|nr:hypothetical protein [Myxococcus sp. CA040A]NTX08276.1 hypothetical protein [Myxococcus sp. CA040A]